MNIEVRRTSLYRALVVSEGGATIDSGLLDAKERNSLAEDLINAAEELYTESGDDWRDFIREWAQ